VNAGIKNINEGGGFTMDENSWNLRRHLVTLTAAFVASGVLGAHIAGAQTSTSGAAPSTPATRDELEEIVVTGTPIATKLLDTSFAITVLSQEKLKESPAIGLAALLSDVPGLYGEGSGGEENLNISPRGVRGGFLEYISLQEDGLPTLYNGFLEELEFRPDLGTDRIEVNRGGPSGVMTSNGAGAIINFISRKATDHPEGEASLSYSSFGSARLDFFYGTPLGNSTSATISGYYRRGDGPKNVGYDANHGGQVKGTLTRLFDDGEITVTYKLIDDHTQFFLPQPVKISQAGSIQRISPITGFNASTANLQGIQTENVDIKTPNGSVIPLDLADGIWEKSNTVTLLAKYDWHNGLTWKDSLRFANINTVDTDLRNLGGNSQIMDANAFLASSTVTNLIAAYASQGAVGAKLVGVASGNVITNPSSMNGNGLVTQMGINLYTQRIDEVINDAQLNFSGFNNVATLGLLTWDQRMHVSQNGVNLLMDVTNHANLLDVEAVNAAGQTVAHLTDNGVLNYDVGYGNGTVDVISNSVYFNDQYHPFDPLRLDAGVRHENVNYKSTVENIVSAPLAGVVNPNILADATAGGYGAGTYQNAKSGLSGTAWTAGANYEITKHLAMYARYSSAFDTGIANFGVFCTGCLPSATTRQGFSEAGLRFATPVFYTELTGFRSVNKNIGVGTSNVGGIIYLNNTATGMEFDARYQPVSFFNVTLAGVAQHSDINGVGGSSTFDGNQIDRLPNLQAHLTPTLSLPSGRASAYVTVSYYGKRWGDLANTIQLDPYTNFDAGVSYKITDNMSLSVQGTNLTDRFSLTEGNPRGNNVIGGTNAYGFARANLPRAGVVKIDVKF